MSLQDELEIGVINTPQLAEGQTSSNDDCRAEARKRSNANASHIGEFIAHNHRRRGRRRHHHHGFLLFHYTLLFGLPIGVLGVVREAELRIESGKKRGAGLTSPLCANWGFLSLACSMGHLLDNCQPFARSLPRLLASI